MNNICFIVHPQACTPGYNERVVCCSPFMQQAVHPQTRQPLYNPQTRQPVIQVDPVKTMQALQNMGYLDPRLTLQHVQYKIIVPEQVPSVQVYCCQRTPVPTVAREQVSAPFQQPVGNPGQNQNDVMPEGTHGGYVEMPGMALPRSSDPLFAEQDVAAGTFQDMYVNQGRETIQEVPRTTFEQQVGPEDYAAYQARVKAAQAAGWVPQQ